MRAKKRKLTPTYKHTNREGFGRFRSRNRVGNVEPGGLAQAPDAPQTRRGAASLYVVIFTTLLLSIITLSFIRIMISENSQTSNSDLSESAYDSAQAGLEDAKVALLRYHDCLSGRATNNCSGIISSMQNGISSDSCDTVRDVLGRPHTTENDEVLVREGDNVLNSESADDLLQAYTCVKIYEDLDDYRTTLSSNFRTRLVPLRTSGGNAQNPNVDKITVRWFSRANNNGGTGTNMMGTSYFMPIGGNAYYPPVIAVSLIQASANGFNPTTDFNVPSSLGGATNRAEVFLRPGGSVSSISASDFSKTQSKIPEEITPQHIQRVQNVHCNGLSADEFACSVDIDLPDPIGGTPRSNNATFLKLDLPYGTPTTDVSITMWNGSNIVNFYGVQAKVDSTGRANDLYRRVETRVELVDIYYPYPEFVIQSDGTNYSDAIMKNYYSTRNCWAADDGSTRDCPNNTQRNY